MRRTAAILTLVAVVSLIGASDVRGGAALTPAGKTMGPAVIATIVIDLTGPAHTEGKGLTSVRVQKAGTSAAVIFTSSYVAGFGNWPNCIAPGFDLPGTAANWFTGKIDGFVDTPSVLNALLQQFGNPSKAAITDQDYVACTTVDIGPAPTTDIRQILSFTAVIQFQP
jgi:hypothetical protein